MYASTANIARYGLIVIRQMVTSVANTNSFCSMGLYMGSLLFCFIQKAIHCHSLHVLNRNSQANRNRPDFQVHRFRIRYPNTVLVLHFVGLFLSFRHIAKKLYDAILMQKYKFSRLQNSPTSPRPKKVSENTAYICGNKTRKV